MGQIPALTPRPMAPRRRRLDARVSLSNRSAWCLAARVSCIAFALSLSLSGGYCPTAVLPKLRPGTLYLMRERDFRTGAWGPYLKIGVVFGNRQSEKRVTEHQTGNPREICLCSNRTIESAYVEHLETQIHHLYACSRVHGEWFDIDDNYIEQTLWPHINLLEAELRESAQDFNQWAHLKDLPSSGKVRAPTPEEDQLWRQAVSAQEDLTLAKANRTAAANRLLALMGTSGGIERVLTLHHTSAEPSFDKALFMEEHPDLYESCLREKPDVVKGTLTITGARTLRKLDPYLYDYLAESEKAFSKVTVEQLSAPPLERTVEICKAHADFLGALASMAKHQWRLERLQARLVSCLGTDDRIEGRISWKRRNETGRSSFDASKLKAEHPGLYQQYVRPKAAPVQRDIHFYRAYPLDG